MQSSIFIVGKNVRLAKYCKPSFKPQHQNDFNEIFATAGTEF